MKDKEVFPMFRRIALLFCILVLTAQPALAAKARGIASDADSDFHAAHLALHTGGEDCSATGNYIKTYRDQARKKLVGHLEIADTVRLLAVENGMAQIEVLVSDSTGPDSYEGMTGWLNADYIDCPCSDSAYFSGDASAVTQPVSGSAFPSDWYFSSGAGAWGTQLHIEPDGTFTGY